MTLDYTIIQIDKQTWRIEEADVRFFLLAGEKEALLIDSGMKVHNAREIAETLTDLPIKLALTHADKDHIGSNNEFDVIYMHPSEYSNYKDVKKFIPLWENDIIDLGNRSLKIISIPGHTPGSIAFLDIKNRILISGDPIQDGRIFMFGSQRNILSYFYSLERVKNYRNEFDTIYPSHGSFPVTVDIIDKLIKGTKKVINHEIEPQKSSFHNITIDEYDIGCAKLLCDERGE